MVYSTMGSICSICWTDWHSVFHIKALQSIAKQLKWRLRDVCLAAHSLVLSISFFLSCTYLHLFKKWFLKQAFLIFCFREISWLQANERILLLSSFHHEKKNVVYFHRYHRLKNRLADFVKKHFENLVKINQSCNHYIKFLKFGEKLIINLTWFFSHFSNVQKLKMPDIQHQCQFLMLQFDNKIIHIFLSWT